MLCCSFRRAGDLGEKDEMGKGSHVGRVAVLKLPEALKLLWDEGGKEKREEENTGNYKV